MKKLLVFLALITTQVQSQDFEIQPASGMECTIMQHDSNIVITVKKGKISRPYTKNAEYIIICKPSGSKFGNNRDSKS